MTKSAFVSSLSSVSQGILDSAQPLNINFQKHLNGPVLITCFDNVLITVAY